MKIFVAHSSDFDFRNKLYIPLRGSSLNAEHEIFLPQENGKERVTKELIKSCGVMVADVSLPSTGEGIELGWADTFGIPIICMYEKGSKISSSLGFVAHTLLEYDNPADMLDKLTVALNKVV